MEDIDYLSNKDIDEIVDVVFESVSGSAVDRLKAVKIYRKRKNGNSYYHEADKKHTTYGDKSEEKHRADLKRGFGMSLKRNKIRREKDSEEKKEAAMSRIGAAGNRAKEKKSKLLYKIKHLLH